MSGIKVIITKCTDDTTYPGFVECEFVDVRGNVHVFEEKIPYLTDEVLDRNSIYPVGGTIACEIVDNSDGSVTVDTGTPWHIESKKGETRFEVSPEQIVEF